MQSGANPNSYRGNLANAAGCYCYVKNYRYCGINSE
jgi:hypothetical protein